MAAYYNEIDPQAAQWLRNLIAAGHIAPGDVDERSIEDVAPDDLTHYTQCHFFAGVGVWSYALRRAGWSDDLPVWTLSCPCQPFSPTGQGRGFADERHLWPDAHWLIEQSQPPTIFGEQVAGEAGKQWLDLVSNDLEGIGYAFGAAILPACGVGAPHIRPRFFFGATNTVRSRLPRSHEHGEPGAQEIQSAWRELARVHAAGSWATWLSESGAPAIIDGAAARVVRTRAYGNAINSQAAQAFIESWIEI